ncbi:MAG: transcriptional activator RfaH [Pseudomonadota bacterium]
MKKWYVAGVLPNKETLAVQQLGRQDFTAFCPKFLKTVSHARKKTTKAIPLFPGYLFVSLDLDRDRWRSVDGTVGLTRLVRFGDTPMPVRGGFADQLWNNADRSGLVEFREQLVLGDRVRAIGGAFDNQIGELVGLPDQDRVIALMTMLGRKVPVTLDQRSVMKVA